MWRKHRFGRCRSLYDCSSRPLHYILQKVVKLINFIFRHTLHHFYTWSSHMLPIRWALYRSFKPFRSDILKNLTVVMLNTNTLKNVLSLDFTLPDHLSDSNYGTRVLYIMSLCSNIVLKFYTTLQKLKSFISLVLPPVPKLQQCCV